MISFGCKSLVLETSTTLCFSNRIFFSEDENNILWFCYYTAYKPRANGTKVSKSAVPVFFLHSRKLLYQLKVSYCTYQIIMLPRSAFNNAGLVFRSNIDFMRDFILGLQKVFCPLKFYFFKFLIWVVNCTLHDLNTGTKHFYSDSKPGWNAFVRIAYNMVILRQKCTSVVKSGKPQTILWKSFAENKPQRLFRWCLARD